MSLKKYKEETAMKIIKAHAFIDSCMDGQKAIENIERVARTCYKSESKIDKDSAAKMISSLIKSGQSSPDNGIYSGGTDIVVHGAWIPFYKGIR